jgi:hypothetical protein
MEYTYEINVIVKIIIVRVFGDLYSLEVAIMDKEIRTKAKELNYKIIFDFRETHNYISILDAYLWYKNNYSNSFFNLSCISVAKITNESDMSFFQFFETTLNNYGVNIKMCTDEISAYKWLENF